MKQNILISVIIPQKIKATFTNPNLVIPGMVDFGYIPVTIVTLRDLRNENTNFF